MLKQKNHLQHGEFKYQTNGSVAAIKWMDNKPVTMLCSCSNPRTMVIVKRQNEDGTISDIGCPEAVATELWVVLINLINFENAMPVGDVQ